MADDETQAEETEAPVEAPAAEAPVTGAEPVAAAEQDTAPGDPTEDATPQPEEEPPSEPSSEGASDDATPDPEEAPVSAPSAEAVPDEILHPKERRRRARQRAGTSAASRTPEERQAERDTLRKQNAKARAERRRKVRAKKPAVTATAAVPEPDAPGTQKTRQGVVVSDKAAKTITVRIDTSRRHRRYKKIVRSSKTLHAHDEHDEAHEGDLVRLIETRPLSATKRWRLVEILERAR
jgi:small subunit ribosomal protein S17